MGCCESTCVLNGREFVHCPDIKPLVMKHTEELLKPKSNAAPCPNASTGRKDIASVGTSGPDCRAQQPRATPCVEAHPLGNIRTCTSTMLTPTISPEVMQFRRLQYRELTPEDYELLCLLDESVPKKDTAPPTVVTGLPRILAGDASTTECHICMARMEPDVRVVPLPCGHTFHAECVSRWLTQCKGTCPLCNGPVLGDCQVVDLDQAPKMEHIPDVDTTTVKKLARASAGRCGLVFQTFDQPGAGDDGPAE